MPTSILTDLSDDRWAEEFALRSADLGHPTASPWSVTKRTLRGGRRDGVDLIQVDNGALSVSVIPTRGMGIWRGQYKADRLGWDSPVADGPVHPAFVDLMAGGGTGWLDGFDEWLARCGLEHNGAPYEEKRVDPNGAEHHTTYPLHGRIANIPAHFVAVHVGDAPPYEITVEGHVTETRLFGPRLRMIATVSTTPGSNRLVVRDEFTNLGDSPAEMQVLYHWNFGPPHLEEGSRLVAPVRSIAPRDPHARGGLARHDTYDAPGPGSAERVYFFELLGQGADGRTLAMLRNRAGDKAVVLRFARAQLPAFTLWKNEGGREDGYVTGLEPGTNYPNPRPFEKARGRVVSLAPGRSHIAETVVEVLDTARSVADVEAEIAALQGPGPPRIHDLGDPSRPGG